MTPAGSPSEGMLADGFILRRYIVTVGHWGEGAYLAASRGKAMADAWRCDAFEGYTFGEFLKMARCRLDSWQPTPTEITVEGRPALGLGHNGQYVQFVYPGKDVVLNAHPLDVLPESYRPRAYRSLAPAEAPSTAHVAGKGV